MQPEELNEILLQAVLDGWEKNSNLQDLEDEMNSYKATCNMFKKTKIAEKNYEYGTTSKTPIREDDKHVSHGRKQRGKEVASPTIPTKGCAGKCNTRHEGYLRNLLTAGKTCL